MKNLFLVLPILLLVFFFVFGGIARVLNFFPSKVESSKGSNSKAKDLKGTFTKVRSSKVETPKLLAYTWEDALDREKFNPEPAGYPSKKKTPKKEPQKMTPKKATQSMEELEEMLEDWENQSLFDPW